MPCPRTAPTCPTDRQSPCRRSSCLGKRQSRAHAEVERPTDNLTRRLLANRPRVLSDTRASASHFGNGNPSSNSLPSFSSADTNSGVMMWLCTSITPCAIAPIVIILNTIAIIFLISTAKLRRNPQTAPTRFTDLSTRFTDSHSVVSGVTGVTSEPPSLLPSVLSPSVSGFSSSSDEELLPLRARMFL